MKHLLLTPLLIGLASPIHATVDNKVHDICLKAADYKGCVELNKTKAKKENGWKLPNVLDRFPIRKNIKQPDPVK